MSQIAQALAKAKERTGHTTAPFMVPGAAVPNHDSARAAAVAAALRRAQIRQRFWIAVVVVALPLTGFICWTQMRPSTVPLAKSPHVPAPPAAGAGSSAAVVEPAVGGSRSASSQSTSAAPAQSLEVIRQVNDLAISAVMPGDPARIMLAGRVVRAGQAIDSGLVFSGIVDGVLQFADTKGAVYTRHY